MHYEDSEPCWQPGVDDHLISSEEGVELIPDSKPGGTKTCLEKETRLLFRLMPLTQWFSNLSVHQNPLEGLLKHKLLGPTPRVLNSVGVG